MIIPTMLPFEAMIFLLFITVFGICHAQEHPPLPLWKSLLMHHPEWTGYLETEDNRYISSFHTHSVQQGVDGLAYVSFMSQHASIEMTVSSDDDKVVVFKEHSVWNKTAHFVGHTDIEFNGQFLWGMQYMEYKGNVSSMETSNFATVTFIPEGEPWKRRERQRNPDSKAALYIGIPIVLGIIVISIGVMILVWSVRKGYLRHVPWAYKMFNNGSDSTPKRGNVELDDNFGQSTTTPPTEQSAVHI